MYASNKWSSYVYSRQQDDIDMKLQFLIIKTILS